MLVALCARLKADSAALLAAHRAAHYRFLVEHQHSIVTGGPMLDEGDGHPMRMLMILRVDSLEAAHALLAHEPYLLNGVFDEVLLQPWRQVLPEIEPGELARQVDRGPR
jgi:uncharacterized protein